MKIYNYEFKLKCTLRKILFGTLLWNSIQVYMTNSSWNFIYKPYWKLKFVLNLKRALKWRKISFEGVWNENMVLDVCSCILKQQQLRVLTMMLWCLESDATKPVMLFLLLFHLDSVFALYLNHIIAFRVWTSHIYFLYIVGSSLWS